jgi:hypothetical protein
MAQQAGAAGFIEDSKATLGLRNFYINNDNRDSAAGSAASKTAGVQSKNEEWGQAFDLRFISGYTQGTVGFGIDAIGLLGVRLDSGGGTNGATGTSYGGTVFPSEHNGDAVDNFSSLGLTAKAKTASDRDQRWSSGATNLAGWPDHFQRHQGPDPGRRSDRSCERS